MSSPDPGPPDSRSTHILEVRTRGLVAEARLNDIPVFTESSGRGRLFQLKCQPYLIDGENELRLWIRLLSDTQAQDESGDISETKAPFCRVRLVRLAGKGAVPEDLLQYAWDPEVEPLVSGRIFEAGPWFFFAESPAGEWTWEASPVFSPTGDDPAEIRVLVDKLWRAVANRDALSVAHLTREKTRELAVALGVNAGELESDQEQYLTALFTSPGWAVAPLEQAGLLLEPAARGRLVEVRTVDGEAPIRAGDGARAFVLRPMVAKIDGRWRIVR